MEKVAGDSFLEKIAFETISPTSILRAKGLDLLEEQLPEDVASQLSSARSLPERLTSKVMGKLKDKEEEGAKSISSDKDLADAMVEKSQTISKEKPVDTAFDRGSRGSSLGKDDFLYDDWDIPMGANFTLMPPYIQI